MKLAYKLRALPLILGVLWVMRNFGLYAGHGLPYPDPTPELLAVQHRQMADAKQGMLLGVAIMALGMGYYFFIKWKNR
jgi:hypothetical protein